MDNLLGRMNAGRFDYFSVEAAETAVPGFRDYRITCTGGRLVRPLYIAYGNKNATFKVVNAMRRKWPSGYLRNERAVEKEKPVVETEIDEKEAVRNIQRAAEDVIRLQEEKSRTKNPLISISINSGNIYINSPAANKKSWLASIFDIIFKRSD